MANLQKNIASQNITFGLVNSSSGAALTGATVTVYVTKDNGAQATGTGTVTEKGNGQYNYAPVQAETNAADVGFLFTATSAIPVAYDFHTDVVDANGYPGANLVDIAGAAVSTSSAQIGVNAVNIGGTAAASATIGTATNLTNAPTAGDFTATMKTSIGTAVAASAVASVTGNVGGNVVGSVGSVTAAVTLTSAYDFAKGTTAMTESYAALHAAPTPVQILYEMRSLLAENSVATTTVTTKKIDGATTAETFTLDSATAPTSITRAS